MDQCDTKIGLIKYVGQWPIFHGPLILPYIIVKDKLFLYIKTWHLPGVYVPLRALALVEAAQYCKEKQIHKTVDLNSSQVKIKYEFSKPFPCDCWYVQQNMIIHDILTRPFSEK